MTTSGTITFNPNRNQIILRAARLVGAIASGETMSSQETQDFSDALNGLTKAWQAIGVHVWAETEGQLFQVPNQISYSLGSSSTDHASANATRAYLSAAAIAGAKTITLVSATGIANGNQIGVFLDSGSYFWTTVNGAPSGNVVTLAAALPSSAALGNPVFAYAAKIERPLRILAARRFDPISKIETPLNVMSRLDFRDLPNKYNTGIVNQIFYDPQLSNGTMWVWTAPQDASLVINFTFMRTIQDFNTATNTPDFPIEWVEALTWNLASSMAVEYSCPDNRYQRIVQRAAEALDLAQGFDREPESVFFGAAFDQSTR